MFPPNYNLTSPNTTLDDNRSFYIDHNTGNQAYYSYYMNVLQKISVTLFSIAFVFGIIGNGLVIWIAGFRMKKTISAVWFLNLAIADFLCCAFLPLIIADKLHILSYTSNVNLFCLLSIIMFTLNVCASILLLTAMSIDRCVSVLWPFWAKVHRTRRLVRITTGGVWVLSLFSAALLLYSKRWCIMSRDYNDYMFLKKIRKRLELVGLLMMFVIPFLIILTSYVIIFLKLRKGKRPQRSQRSYRIIITIILGFFICWFPFYIWPLIPKHNLDYILWNALYTVIINLAFLNSCINPIIYVFMGQNFRHSFLRSIPARLERALTVEPEGLTRQPEDLELTCSTK